MRPTALACAPGRGDLRVAWDTPQRDALRRGVDVVVATPGRLIDHLQQRSVDLTGVLTLDEAGRMLDL